MDLPNGKKWGICITHDVNHLGHTWDNFLKHLFISFVEMTNGRRTLKQLQLYIRNRSLSPDSWYCLDEWIDLETTHEIPATYFFCTQPGRNVKYTVDDVSAAAGKLGKFAIGVHGQNSSDILSMKHEFSEMKRILGKPPQGIRMHSLKTEPPSHTLLTRTGYVFDSSEYDETLKQPYKKGQIVIIPYHIKGSLLVDPFLKNFTPEEAIAWTEKLIERAKREKKVIVANLQQRSLAPEFIRERAYCRWLYEQISGDDTCWKASCADLVERTMSK